MPVFDISAFAILSYTSEISFKTSCRDNKQQLMSSWKIKISWVMQRVYNLFAYLRIYLTWNVRLKFALEICIFQYSLREFNLSKFTRRASVIEIDGELFHMFYILKVCLDLESAQLLFDFFSSALQTVDWSIRYWIFLVMLETVTVANRWKQRFI